MASGSGWNLWVWLVGGSVSSACGCKEVYRFPHTTYPYSSCICSFLQQHPYFLSVNPRRACAAIITVVVLCVCMYVHVCVSTQTCHLTHWNHKREIPTDSTQYRDRFKFC